LPKVPNLMKAVPESCCGMVQVNYLDLCFFGSERFEELSSESPPIFSPNPYHIFRSTNQFRVNKEGSTSRGVSLHG